MAEFSSFYGGRQGAPFIIKKRFDAINEERLLEFLEIFLGEKINKDNNNGYYLRLYLLTTTDGKLVLDDNNDVIILNSETKLKVENDKKGYVFNKCVYDGTTMNAIIYGTQNTTTYTLKKTYYSTMEEFFAKGIETTSEVNYGEYVIIDTISSANDKRNADNGKVFMRGFEGAVYIGQIVGPEGETLALSITDINDDRLTNISPTKSLKVGAGLIPGREYEINDDGAIIFNGTIHNTIDYKEKTILDEYGNASLALLGMQIPNTEFNFMMDGNSTPYSDYKITQIAPMKDEEGKYVNTPFYKEAIFTIPGGKHGTDISGIKIEPKYVKAGAKIYSNPGLTVDSGTVVSADTELYDYIQANETSGVANAYGILVKDSNQYVRPDDCYEFHLVYVLRNYENKAEGELSSDYVIDNYKLKSITDVNLVTEQFEYKSVTGEKQNIFESKADENTQKIDIHFDDNTHTYLSKPINGIKEITLCRPDVKDNYGNNLGYFPESLNTNIKDINYKDLLVLYEDPAKRPENGVTYYSKTTTDGTHTGGYVRKWLNLGQGFYGRDTLKCKLKVPSDIDIEDLNTIPPEQIKLSDDGTEVISGNYDSYFSGWVIAQDPVDENGDPIIDEDSGAPVTIFYYYDYDLKKWIEIGSLNEGLINPKTIISIGTTLESNQLNKDGVLLETVKVYYVQD